MSNNLTPFIKVLTSRQSDYLLKVLVAANPDIHAGSMWFLNRDAAVKALNDHVIAKKNEACANSAHYFDPKLDMAVTILETIEGEFDAWW